MKRLKWCREWLSALNNIYHIITVCICPCMPYISGGMHTVKKPAPNYCQKHSTLHSVKKILPCTVSKIITLHSVKFPPPAFCKKYLTLHYVKKSLLCSMSKDSHLAVCQKCAYPAQCQNSRTRHSPHLTAYVSELRSHLYWKVNLGIVSRPAGPG